MNNLDISYDIFEKIKHVDDDGKEYWLARELKETLEYKKWQKFLNVIESSINNCIISGFDSNDHFTLVGKMVDIGSNSIRKIIDYKLSRYACYLIMLNCDAKKRVVSLGKTYFAFQTRKMEILEMDYDLLTEDEKRFYQRKISKMGNSRLNQQAKKSEVKNFDKFHNSGYKGLYNGETADDIAKRKGLRYKEEILDNMGLAELSMNIFRISQTEETLRNKKIKGEKNANDCHYKVGKSIRNLVKELGGTMPEDLPTPEKSLKKILKSKEFDKYLK